MKHFFWNSSPCPCHRPVDMGSKAKGIRSISENRQTWGYDGSIHLRRREMFRVISNRPLGRSRVRFFLDGNSSHAAFSDRNTVCSSLGAFGRHRPNSPRDQGYNQIGETAARTVHSISQRAATISVISRQSTTGAARPRLVWPESERPWMVSESVLETSRMLLE